MKRFQALNIPARDPKSLEFINYFLLVASNHSRIPTGP